jgi:outer membrane protein assembly factor BamB
MHMSSRTAKIVTFLAAALAVLTGIGITAVSAVTVSSPWSQTDSNSALSRANLTEQTLTSATVGKVRYLRGVAAPLILPGQNGCAGGFGVFAPVLTGGSMYAITEGRLTKYNPATGAILWQRTPDPTFRSLYKWLAVSYGLVIIGGFGCYSETNSQGSVQAFNASTGALVWSSGTGGYLPGQMVVPNGYVVTSALDQFGEQVAVRKTGTGAVVWSNNSGGACGSGALLVVARKVIWESVNCDTGTTTLMASNLSNGTLAWSDPGNWQVQRGDSGLSSGHLLYATSPGGTVVALDPLTGKTRYSLAGAGQVLAVDSSRVYADCGSLGVCAYSTASGSRQWSAQPGYTANLAAEAGGVLYLDNGNALNAATGKTIISLPASPAARALVIGDGRIAMVTDPRVIDLYGLPGY